MISYNRDPQQTIPESAVKIVGLGGAGANMLDRATLDGMTGPEMLCVNTDMRTLSSSVAGEKIQIGKNLTKGLGAGGDPDLGHRAAMESEQEIRDALRGRQLVFLCVGLGGGTGSGAAPLITRIAREAGAFVVVFATMPFEFEGERRHEQAESALNELAALSNALITFDNNRMGELVLAKQGIHEAFAAADRMVSESIKAVTRLVTRPGLIHVGLDELMSALRTNRSRCLFGSGVAEGENRIQLAVENALHSPLLDKGSLLDQTDSVLVHLCGDESLTLYEVELLMQNLTRHISDDTEVLFGVATDPDMGGSLSVTIFSALPEEKLQAQAANEPLEVGQQESPQADHSEDEMTDAGAVSVPSAVNVVTEQVIDTSEDQEVDDANQGQEIFMTDADVHELGTEDPEQQWAEDAGQELAGEYVEEEHSPDLETSELDVSETGKTEQEEVNLDELPDFADHQQPEADESAEVPFAETINPEQDDAGQQAPANQPQKQRSLFANPFAKSQEAAQGELELDGGPKGKFEGETPNVVEGEDLDIPAFLRKKRR